MAKINVLFDGTDYPIEESSLSDVSGRLATHLSSVMNGSGATINLGGTSYGVDETKLTSETNEFVTYLGTIAGSGMKVIVNGVEYGVDSTKVSGAISALHACLSGLKSGGGDAGEIQKNQYGFYYNVPYVYRAEENMDVVIFYENNTMTLYWGLDGADLSQMFTFYGTFEYTYDEESRTASAEEFEWTYVFSGDGESVVHYDSIYVADKTIIPRGVEYGKTYTCEQLDSTFVFNEDNTVTVDGSITFDVSWDGNWFYIDCRDTEYWFGQFGSISLDGSNMFLQFGE